MWGKLHVLVDNLGHKVIVAIQQMKGTTKCSFSNDIKREILQKDPDVNSAIASARIERILNVVVNSIDEWFQDIGHVMLERIDILGRKSWWYNASLVA